MTRRELRTKRQQHLKLKRRRAIIRRACGAVGILLAAFLVFLLLRGIVRAIADRPAKPKKTETAESVYEDFGTDTDAGNTAVRKALSGMSGGQVGWNVDENGWWYRNGDATQFTSGWQTIDGQRYCFGEDGYLLTGWAEVDGKDVFFRQSGIEDPTAKRKRVALTFDDGPASHTDRILNVLNQYNAKATFFVVGTQAEYYTSQLKREYEEGMEIGSHTYNHDTLYGADPDAIIETMEKNDRTINGLLGTEDVMKIMRPTGGGYDANVRGNVGRPMIIWDLDTLDWSTKDADTTYNTIMNEIQDGSIILMHDIWEPTATATERIVPKLAEMGYKMVTVSELAEAYGYDLEDGVPYYSFYPQTEEESGEGGEDA